MDEKAAEAMLHSGESSPPPPYSDAVSTQADAGTVYFYPSAPAMDTGAPGQQYMPPAAQYPVGQYPPGPGQQYPPGPGQQYPPGPGQQYPPGPYPPPAMPYPQQPKYPPGGMLPPQGPQAMAPVMVQPVGSGTTTVVYQQQEAKVNTMGSIILSCVVFWCCNCPFGIIAFVLAMIAQSRSDSGDRTGALSLQKTSMLFSFLGIIITIILIIVIFSLS